MGVLQVGGSDVFNGHLISHDISCIAASTPAAVRNCGGSYRALCITAVHHYYASRLWRSVSEPARSFIRVHYEVYVAIVGACEQMCPGANHASDQPHEHTGFGVI